jgi:hypothetical protein
MSNKQPPRVQFDFEPDPIPESVPPPSQSFELPEGEPPSIDVEISDEVSTSELELPSIEKQEIIEDDIFQMPDNLAVRPDYLPPQEPKKPVKRKGVNKDGTKRKPMSEEHKQKLALAREKARIVKMEKSKVRQEEKALEKEEKELLKKQKVKRVQKLKAEVEEDEEPVTSTKTPTVSQQRALTLEDIQKAQFEAIMSYETLRKARKEEKKKAQMLEKQREDMKRTIQQHTQPKRYQYRDGSNPWDKCY